MARYLDHPLPQRVSHWINLITASVLTATGLLLFRARVPGPIDGMEGLLTIHLIVAFAWISNGVFRVYYSFFGKYADYKDYVFRKGDGKAIWETLKYYLHLRSKPLKTHRYDPLQRTGYILFLAVAVVQIVTGIVLVGNREVLAHAVIGAMGGLARVRAVHFMIAWLGMAMVLVHAYLACTEAWDQAVLMFTGKAEDKGR